MQLSADTRLGPYEILSPLGAGGMGEVYRARDTRLGREVAVKVLPADVAGDSERLRRFEQEARAASSLNHPNILTVFDVGADSGVSYLVTELLEGEPLRERLERGRLPTPLALELAVQTARGLVAAHEKGIVHRDLKPENLFLTLDGRIKILDFGLARIVQPKQSSADLAEAPTFAGTETGTVLGTAGYMAPEQVQGEPVDARADLFAFGCVLCEMLTGERAFRGESAIDVLHAIVRGEPAPLAEDRREPLPAALERLLRRCLEKKPAARFQSARDLLYALEEARETATAAGVTQVWKPLVRRRRGLAVGLGIAAVAVVLALVFALGIRWRETTGNDATPIDSLAVLPLANLSGDPQQEYFADGMTEALIAELAKLEALKVISRTSVMRYKGTDSPLPEIARELRVRGIIEGSVLRDADQVRITVQLIDAGDDRHLWAESYTRPARDVLRLQSEVARAIAREVRIAVSPEEEKELAAAPEVDPEAHRLLLQARALDRRGGSQLAERQRIAELVERAIELAPDDASARALRGAQLYSLAFTGYEAGTIACPRAREEVDRALELDPRSIAARTLDATLLQSCEHDWTGAIGVYRGLLATVPGNAELHDNYAQLLSRIGRHEEALEHSRRAYELDPLNDWIGGNRVYALMRADRHAEAVAFARRVLELSPESVYVKWTLANSQLAMGDVDGALETYLSREVSRPAMNFMVGFLYARSGRREQAREVLDYLLERRRQRYVPASMIGVVYGGLGDTDEAFEWLERAYEERDFFLLGLREFYFDPLRESPRFAALAARMNFPPPL